MVFKTNQEIRRTGQILDQTTGYLQTRFIECLIEIDGHFGEYSVLDMMTLEIFKKRQAE